MYDIKITEKEIRGKTYELWKKQMATPASIQYAIFDGDEIVLKCDMAFTQCMIGADPNFIYEYEVLDEYIAEPMFRHLRRNLTIKQNQEKMKAMNKAMNLEKKLAAFDAKVLRDKAKRQNKK